MEKIEESILYQGKWLSIKETHWKNGRGENFAWESIVRTRNSKAVVIIPQLMPSKKFVLIKQFRPAIETYILGFPAGLDNDSDDLIVEELKEETGYIGTIKNMSPYIKSGSGIINDTGRVVHMCIDENDPINANPSQQLEASEDIEVLVVDKDSIKEFLIKSHEEGLAIGANLWYLFVVSDWIH